MSKVHANGLMIEVDDQGPRDAPVVLLVMGLGMQLTGWPDELVELLVAHGFRHTRTHPDYAGRPRVTLAASSSPP